MPKRWPQRRVTAVSGSGPVWYSCMQMWQTLSSGSSSIRSAWDLATTEDFRGKTIGSISICAEGWFVPFWDGRLPRPNMELRVCRGIFSRLVIP